MPVDRKVLIRKCGGTSKARAAAARQATRLRTALRAPAPAARRLRAVSRRPQEYLAQLGALSGVLGLRTRCDSSTLGIRFGALVCARAADHCLAQCVPFAAAMHASLARALARLLASRG